MFLKPAASTAGPLDPIVIPTICQDGQVDYEAELAVVIGKPCKNVSKEEALDYVAGIHDMQESGGWKQVN